MSFKTSHKKRKKRGRWSKSGYVKDTIYSCPNCFKRYEMPHQKADGTAYCIHCFMITGIFHEVKQTKVFKRK